MIARLESCAPSDDSFNGARHSSGAIKIHERHWRDCEVIDDSKVQSNIRIGELTKRFLSVVCVFSGESILLAVACSLLVTE